MHGARRRFATRRSTVTARLVVAVLVAGMTPGAARGAEDDRHITRLVNEFPPIFTPHRGPSGAQ